MNLNILKICLDIIQLSELERAYSQVNGYFKIENCFFQRFHMYKGYNSLFQDPNGYCGGVIYCYSVNSELDIIETAFLNCSCSGYGGVLFFHCHSSTSSKLNLKKICANSCFTISNTNYPFGFLAVSQYTNNSNFLDYVSISKCSPFFSNGNHVMEIKNGCQLINNLNSSFNSVIQNSGIFSSVANLMISSFNTFSHNNSSYYCCFYGESGLNNKIEKSNFLFNNSPQGNGVVSLAANAKYKIWDCIFISNLNILFSIPSGSQCEIFFCYIDHYHTLNSGIIFTSSIFLNFTSTFCLIHYKNELCYIYNYETRSLNFKIQNSHFSFNIILILNFLSINI